MAKKSQTWHGKALAAFTTQRITCAEYIACLKGLARISGVSIIFRPREMGHGRLSRPRARRLDKIIPRTPATAQEGK